jgi:hypothetical protein
MNAANDLVQAGSCAARKEWIFDAEQQTRKRSLGFAGMKSAGANNNYLLLSKGQTIGKSQEYREQTG